MTPACDQYPEGWLVAPTTEQTSLFNMLQWNGSIVRIAWLVVLCRRAPRSYRIGWQLPIPSPRYPARPAG
jgi:hypothetical protein